MARLTVALPVYNSKQIAWLAMEGLCNQITTVDWELIIAEEQHEQMLGLDFFEAYRDRLQEAGCSNITYMHYDTWIPLPVKWRDMGEQAHQDSEVFMLQAADCYSHPNRIQQSYQAITNGYDWVDWTDGLFYNIRTCQMIQYSYKARTNLNMAFRTRYARQIPLSSIRKSIDGFLYTNMMALNPKAKPYRYHGLPLNGLDTDGYNNISRGRARYYDQVNYPFSRTDLHITDLLLPAEVIERLLILKTE